ncbi:outer membrane beta-barrel family protein [uncultured Chitinophaga sp.]|uniref:outer membrane beta-barrel family protein n=1 Tax=uncultured Chitinophaga sp. TaxID=339340 RepID=UPI0025FF1D9C|nr:outer membrane beta-barrel family protein [uncultured Chitinophaga sp.]
MKTVITSFLLFLHLSTYGQGRIAGQVNTPSATPASFATVALLKAADSAVVKGAVCDSLGNYTIVAPYGRYLLAATQVGMAKTYSAPFVTDSINSHVTMPAIVLVSRNTLKEVAVNAQKPYVEMQIDKMVLNVENSVMAQGNTLFDLLVHAPGIRPDKDENLVMMGKSGVQVWIDGRPSNLSGESLTAWLKAQPADVVAKIELISQPSARFDAGGSAGIINIRLKKNMQQGVNGNAYTSLAMGKYPKASAGLNLNYRKDKLNFFGNYSYNYSESFNYRTLNTVIHGKGKESYMDYDNYWHPVSDFHFLKIGADYKPTAKTTIGFIVNGNLSSSNNTTEANTFVYDIPTEKSLLAANSRGNDDWSKLSYNLNLLHEIDSLGSTLNLDADYSNYGKEVTEGIENRNNSGALFAQIRAAAPTDVDALSFKADYTKYFSKTLRLEAGFKVNRVQTDNDLRYDSLLQNVWEPDVNRSNQFVYTENIQAAYVTLAKEWKKWTLQAGLRAERTEATGYSVTLGQKVKRRYTGLFPTVNVMKKINETNDLSFSYSRRIDRPSYGSLNPFIVAIDPYNRQVGNPYLNPSYSNTFQLRHGFKQALWTTLYYSRGNRDVVRLISQDSVTKIQTTTSENLGSSDYGYISVSLGLPVTSWWQLDFSGGVGYAEYRSNTFTNGNWGAETSLDNTFTIFKDLRLAISMFYNTAAPSGQQVQRANYGGRFSASKPVFRKQGRVSFGLQDPFNMQRYDADIYTNASTIRWVNRWESRKVSLSFSWKFGSQQIKAVRERKNSMGDVENRVNM